MRKIRVNKADLITKITEQRDLHKSLYDEAVVVYRQRAIQEIEKMLQDARTGEIRRGFILPVPEEHTEDFDRALRMLEWELDDEVVLDETDFATLVQNEWGWARAFAQNTSSYVQR